MRAFSLGYPDPPSVLACEFNSRARKWNDFLASAVKVTVEVTVEVASSSLLFASFFFYSFSSKRVLDYASSQLGTNQYWFIINKNIQHFFVREASSPCNGNHFLVIMADVRPYVRF